jgi:hypothetical protein
LGAPNDDNAGGFDAGSAYVYLRNGGSWTLQQKLTASDAAAADEYGHSVSISGDTIVVGAMKDDNARGTDAGAAYVYVRTGGGWIEQQKLVASDGQAGDAAGTAISISGDTTVVGAIQAQAGGPGAAYVFLRIGGVWIEQQRLGASDGNSSDQFGRSVSLSDDTAVVGAPLDTNAGGVGAGAAYVFMRSGGTWTEQQKLVASDAAPYDAAGIAVAVFEDSIVVGAFLDNHPGGTDAGSAYVFRRTAATWTEWQKLVASDAASDDNFGASVSNSSDTVVIGAPGDQNAGGLDAGSAYLYSRSGGTWTERQQLLASDAQGVDHFGHSVALSEETVLVAAREDEHSGMPNAGSAYVFACAFANQAPACDAGADVSQSCDGVQLAGSASDPGGAPLAFRWTSSCAGASFAPSDDVLDPIVTFGSACGVSCDLTLTVDAGGAICSDVVHVEIDDTTAPSIVADARDSLCVWSPRHWWACYERADFHPVVTDDCGAPTWRFLDCASDQPADGNGDGHTDPDCLVSPDGERICVRAERQGGEPAGRTYTVTIEAVDACGNASHAAIGTITIPHDGRNHPDCRVTPRGGRRPPTR